MDLTQLIAAAWREERERYTLYAYTDGSWVLDQHGPEDIALALIEGTREACQAHLDLLCARAAEKALKGAGIAWTRLYEAHPPRRTPALPLGEH